MRGAGVGTRIGAASLSFPDADSALACGGRVATTDRVKISLGGLMPLFSLGAKLAGVTVTRGSVWMGFRFFASTCVTRAVVIGPRPKWFSFTTTTEFLALTFL